MAPPRDPNPPPSHLTVLAFTEAQRHELSQLGVVPAQIGELEAALPLCRAMMGDAAPMAAVRSELAELEQAMASARRALERFAQFRDADKAIEEAYTRVQMVSLDRYERLETIEHALESVSTAEHCAQLARERLPAEQRRSNRASWAPVQTVHNALIRGWGVAHYPVRSGKAPNERHGLVPPFPHQASSGITSQFRQIVGVCYEAIRGSDFIDPERAIKAYVRWLKSEKAREAKATPQGRRRQSKGDTEQVQGRQTPKRRGLPS